ncbi:PDDEXK-like family protein [Pseudoalteromonas aliena]|uniref:PD-(D/E)XK nuclease superfamily protein n=1 Tax=Pseudoalteromonas aliena SW19 TaxID=1314866 RepID=A0ABR9E3U8_9GAMM|nr:PD-(D/E)XK nuclease family protein [Pseudoalteromonas aliena]MBE0361227.1 hypothetical protein [Pseudoalteromonas aliena SW19]
MSVSLLEKTFKLLLDKNFKALSSRSEETSVLELIKFDENKKSDVLAWLLDPNGGHQQGDYFLKALLYHVFNVADDEQLGNFLSSFELLSNSTSQAKVIREFPINAGAGRIDLLVLDPSQKLAVVIERKDGSRLQNQQLNKYASWIEANYADWNKVYVLSDSYFKNHGDEYDARFVKVDDTWLSDAILDVIGRELLTKRQEHQLQDVHDFIFAEWDEKRDPYCKNYNKLLNTVSANHFETLRLLEKQELKYNKKLYPFIELTPLEYFGYVLPNAHDYDDWQLKLAELIQHNHKVFNQLHGLNEFGLFEETILKQFPQLSICIEDSEMLLMLTKHTPSEDDYWPYYLEIKRDKKQDNQDIYTVSINASRYSPEDFHHLAEKVADTYKMKRQSNWRSKHEILLENIETLALDGGGDSLYHVIKDFYDAIKGIKLKA